MFMKPTLLYPADLFQMSLILLDPTSTKQQKYSGNSYTSKDTLGMR